MSVVAVKPQLYEIVDKSSEVSTVAGGFQFTEGPVWDAKERSLIFSDIPGDTVYRWRPDLGVQAVRRPSNNANGNTFDGDGRLLTCEHAGRRVARSNPDGSVVAVATSYQARRLNSPNDLVCAANGDIYFTDPPYGLRRADGSFDAGDLGFNGVFRWSAADGTLTLLVDDFVRPNGIALSGDEHRLFIADTQLGHIRAFDVEDGQLRNGRVFVQTTHEGTIARPDGIKLDREGNLYVASSLPSGVWVYSPAGELLGMIGVDESPANLAFGGDDWQTLFVTAQTSVFRIRLEVCGQPVGGL